MTGFSVKPGTVASYGNLVQSHAGYFDQASRYAAQEGRVDDSSVGSIFKMIFNIHFEAQELVCDYLNRAGVVCRDSGQGLLKAADMYRGTEASNAARVDATYPGEDNRPVVAGPVRSVAEYAHPPDRLTPPAEPEDFEDPGGIVDTISDLLSPAKWIQEIVDSVLGVNPVEKAVEPYTGDWRAIAKASGAFHCLAYFCGDASKNLGQNVASLRADWQGHAAANAEAYFVGFSDALDSYRQGCEKLRDEYATTAKGIADSTKAVLDRVSDLMDDAFWAAIEVAAGGVLVETGVGPAILWSLAAVECQGIVDAWKDVTKSWETAKYIAESFNGAVTGLVGDTSYFKAHQPPGVAYAHPGVR